MHFFVVAVVVVVVVVVVVCCCCCCLVLFCFLATNTFIFLHALFKLNSFLFPVYAK